MLSLVRLISLQSGSSGNCVFVESQDTRILIDAGLSPTQVEERLAPYQINPKSIDALVISHDHSDHIRCADAYARRFKIPVFATERTVSAARRNVVFSGDSDLRFFCSGNTIQLKSLKVETVSTPHDAADGSVFVVDDGRHRIGVCTDVGHVFQGLKEIVRSVDGLFLESNYDEEMLASGHYPAFLKNRISGSKGHISNREAAQLVEHNAGSRLQWLILAHLSKTNNTPKKALETHRKILGSKLPIYLTNRFKASPAVDLGGINAAPNQLAFDFLS